jgi:phosphoglycolate phosphatase-like HAD superfamily hydrolase
MTRIITLKEIWDGQREYNNIIRNSRPLSYEEWMEKYLLGTVSEMNEVLDEMSWKVHRRGKKINRTNLARELADLTKYVFSLWEWSGFSHEDLLHFVHQKNTEMMLQWSQDFAADLPEYSKIVITDIDGTLADYRKGFVDWLQNTHGEDLPEDSASSLAMEIDLGLSYPKYVTYKEEFEAGGGYATLPSYPEVKQVFSDLHASGIKLLAYTARPAQSHSRIWSDTWQWMKDVEIAGYFRELRIGREQRIARACELQAQGHQVVMLEDEPDTALRAAHAGIIVFLREQPYNQGIQHDNIIAVHRLSTVHIQQGFEL